MPEFNLIHARKSSEKRSFMIFSRKINKIPKFYMIFLPEVPKFYIITSRKIFFPIFFVWGGHMLVPPSAPDCVSALSFAYVFPKSQLSLSTINEAVSPTPTERLM